ncbi:MAG: thiamine-phosphate kinase [Deltaproteobacteria bacterium]|nr:thiamine-phosphate kinase [Deltaproteobacteria bacterium]
MSITKKTLQDIGEFGLIAKIRNWMATSRPEVVRSIGDDVAVIDMGQKALLLTTDILIEDIHFERSWTDPYRLGRKSLAVNISDIAAMGGTPKYFLISIGLPKRLPLSFTSLFYRGLKDEARRFQVDLIGGDTSLSPKIIINICLIGEGKKGNILFRNGAKVGDDLYASGTLGDAALGLKILQDKGLRKKPKGLVNKHLSPTPRVELGQALAKKHIASAMIDISDGLLNDTNHILEESKVGAQLWEDRIPLSTLYRRWAQTYSKAPYQIALSGGEDYELLFTASPQKRAKVSSLARSLNIPLTRVGEILPEKEGVHLIRKGGKEVKLPRLGFDHFR